jgi:hypothetical protein
LTRPGARAMCSGVRPKRSLKISEIFSGSDMAIPEVR